jgi:very-short-patch-repair endonuclease
MSHRARLPAKLLRAPFTLADAHAAGLSDDSLSGKSWRRLGAGLYCWAQWREDKWSLLAAWRRTLPDGAVFSGRTAASLHGLDFDAANPVEVTVIPPSSFRSRRGLVVRQCALQRDEVLKVRNLPVTALARTLLDLCTRWTRAEALVALDMALHLKRVDKVGLLRYVNDNAGQPGVKAMRELVRLAEPAESPMETRLRSLMRQGGLPRPEVQTNLYDQQGGFIGRVDLYYPTARVAIEFDGSNHRDRLVADVRRQNQLINAGFTVLRFTSADVLGRPQDVIAEVRGALALSAGFVQNSKLGPRVRAGNLQKPRS